MCRAIEEMREETAREATHAKAVAVAQKMLNTGKMSYLRRNFGFCRSPRRGDQSTGHPKIRLTPPSRNERPLIPLWKAGAFYCALLLFMRFSSALFVKFPEISLCILTDKKKKA